MNKKALHKITALLLTFMLIVTAFPVSTIAANPLISVKSTEVEVGKTAEVEIYMENTPGIVNLILNVGYDNTALTLTEIRDGGILGTAMHTQNLSLCPYQLTWANDLAYQDFTQNGKLVTLVFEVSKTAELKDYDITLSYNESDIINFDMQKVSFDTQDGVISVVKKDFDFEIVEEKIIIKGYKAEDENLVIPEKIKTGGKEYPVIGIADEAFKDNATIKTVTIPASVKNIGDKAFYNCTSLSEATLVGTDTVIGEKAFGYIKVDDEQDKVKEGFVIKSKPDSTAETYAGTDEALTFECAHFNTQSVDGRAAECMKAGLTAGLFCNDCSTWVTPQEEIKALDHDYTGDVRNEGNGTHSFKCKNGCGTYGGTVSCSGGTATCTAKAVCSVCKVEYGVLASHSFTNYVSNKDATCLANGTKTAKCNNCTETDTVEDTGSMKNHSYTGEYKDNGNGTHSRKCVSGCGEYSATEAHTGMSDFVCDKCGYTDTAAKVLSEAKTAAKKAVDNAAGVFPSSEMKKIVSEAKTNIDNATTTQEVENAKQIGLQRIEAQKEAEKPTEPTSDVCPKCGKTHADNFWGKIVCFFNRIGNFFRNLFS